MHQSLRTTEIPLELVEAIGIIQPHYVEHRRYVHLSLTDGRQFKILPSYRNDAAIYCDLIAAQLHPQPLLSADAEIPDALKVLVRQPEKARR